MYDIILTNVKNTHEYEELIKVFLRPQQYKLECIEDVALIKGRKDALCFCGTDDKNALKKEIYKKLRDITGSSPPWGIITGIRPVKLAGELIRKLGSETQARAELLDCCMVNEKKADLAIDIYRYQQRISGKPPEKSAGIYIGIPFCPTRCLYCSFVSNQKGKEEIDKYLRALYKEIDYVSRGMKEQELYAETIYIGGGTPTILDNEQLETFLCTVNEKLRNEKTLEITLEAGRPDTITKSKLEVIHDADVRRISINPQTMNDQTLKIIGREHTAMQIREAFKIARDAGIKEINADIIAGLPGEDIDDFTATVKEISKLEPDNITVHNLALKRASRLTAIDRDYHYKIAGTVNKMLRLSRKKMKEAGYRPYYLYRQKQTAGAEENTGYCKPGTECIYNIRIMDEHQNLFALGAGGISKVYFPKENRHERVANVSNYEIYIDRIGEMIERKRSGMFAPLKEVAEI